MTFEDAVDAVTVADARISPDGRRVVYVAAGVSATATATICLVDVAGGEPRRLVTGVSPRWSPDGERVAFVHEGRLCVLGVESGEVAELSEATGEVLDLAWSPAGERIAFRGPAGLGLATPDGAVELLAPIGEFGFSWSPDGTSLVATQVRTPAVRDSFDADLVVIDLQGGVRRLCHFEGLPLPGLAPQFSPDGSTIAFNAAVGGFPAYFGLHLVPAAGGEVRVVAPDYEASVYDFAWLPSGSELAACVHERQESRIVVLDVAGGVRDAVGFEAPGTIAPLFGPPFSLSADGRRVAFVRAVDRASLDVYAADLGGRAQPLTDVNPWVRDRRLGEVRELAWTSFDGAEIEGVLVFPVDYDERLRYPTVVELHGGFSSWGRGLHLHCEHWAQHLAHRGYAVLLPNPRGSAGRGPRFMRVDPWGEPDGQDVLAGVDRLVELGIADPDRLGLGGASYGGYLTNWLVAHSDRFRAAVSVCGIADWRSFPRTSELGDLFGFDAEAAWEHSPLRLVDDVRTPTLFLSGAEDRRVAPSQGQELHASLVLRGIESELVLYPREGHAILEREHQLNLLQRVTAWFDRHLAAAGVRDDANREGCSL